MSASINTSSPSPRRVLLVVANPAVSSTLGWPVGFWASEMTHPYYELTEAGYEVDLASPDGGKVELDGYSDPRHESGYSAGDLVSMGFLHTRRLAALLDSTKKLADARPDDYDAILIAGGQSPMFTMIENPTVQKTVTRFYEAGKVTAALCHGVAALLNARLSDGSYLIAGKTITGFSNAEEDAADAMVGKKVMPFRIEDTARTRGANYVSMGAWREYAVRDGRLITGQQQYSGRATARLVIEVLGR